MKYRPNTFQLREFHCPECNTKMTAPKIAKYAKKVGANKWMYCYKCKCDRNFIMDSGTFLRV